MKIHYLLTCGVIVLGITALLCLRPVPTVPEEDCLVLNAVVAEIYEDGVKDVVFRFHGHDKTFYINRGLERGLDLKTLRFDLIGREITIKYPDYWTPLDPGKTNIHLSKIELDGRIVFSEL